jgi:hypothetical protein
LTFYNFKNTKPLPGTGANDFEEIPAEFDATHVKLPPVSLIVNVLSLFVLLFTNWLFLYQVKEGNGNPVALQTKKSPSIL